MNKNNYLNGLENRFKDVVNTPRVVSRSLSSWIFRQYPTRLLLNKRCLFSGKEISGN